MQKFKYIILLLILTIGCAHNASQTPPSEVGDKLLETSSGIKHSAGFYTTAEVSAYLTTFLGLWFIKFGTEPDAVFKTIRRTSIHWQKEIFTYADRRSDARLLGLTQLFTDSDKVLIFIATSADGQDLAIDETALGHELIHLMLLVTTGNLQANHFSKKGSGTWPIEYESFLNDVSELYRFTNESKRISKATRGH